MNRIEKLKEKFIVARKAYMVARAAYTLEYDRCMAIGLIDGDEKFIMALNEMHEKEAIQLNLGSKLNYKLTCQQSAFEKIS